MGRAIVAGECVWNRPSGRRPLAVNTSSTFASVGELESSQDPVDLVEPELAPLKMTKTTTKPKLTRPCGKTDVYRGAPFVRGATACVDVFVTVNAVVGGNPSVAMYCGLR